MGKRLSTNGKLRYESGRVWAMLLLAGFGFMAYRRSQRQHQRPPDPGSWLRAAFPLGTPRLASYRFFNGVIHDV
jgi:hypothetical protein